LPTRLLAGFDISNELARDRLLSLNGRTIVAIRQQIVPDRGCALPGGFQRAIAKADWRVSIVRAIGSKERSRF